MPVKNWPQNIENKEHLIKSEESLLRSVLRRFKEELLAVDIEPCGLGIDRMLKNLYGSSGRRIGAPLWR